MSNERYTRNRNMWRKTYPIVRHKPRIIELITPGGITASINLETYQRHRSYYSLYPDLVYLTGSAPPEPQFTIWEDGKVFSDGTEDQTFTVNFVGRFFEPPTVCYKVYRSGPGVPSGIEDIFLEELDGWDSWTKPMPLIYGVGTPTTQSAQFKLSYPYSGSIHYFATAATTSFPIEHTASTYFADRPQQTSAGISESNGLTSQSLVWETLTYASNPNQVFVLQTPYYVPGSGSESEATRAIALSSAGVENYNELAGQGQNASTSGTDTNASATGSFYYHYIAYRVIPL